MKRFLKRTGNLLLFSLSSEFALILAVEIIISIALSVLALVLFFKLGDDIFHKEVFHFDTTITTFLYHLRNPFLNTVMQTITFLGSGIFLVCASVLTIFYLYTKRRKDALIFSAILYSGIIINLLLKELFHRPRPHLLSLVHENTFSFPSGHAMNSFVFYTALTYFILRATKNVKLTIITSSISTVLILIIGISRIYLGAHYPSDVIAGYIGGFFWFVAAILFEKTIIFERLYKRANKKRYEKE